MLRFFSRLIVILCPWFGVKRRDVVFIQQSLSTDSTAFDSWNFVGRQSDSQSKTISHAGLAGLHPFSDTLGQRLRHWPDCQSYLSQLRLAIRLVVASVAFFPLTVPDKRCQHNLWLLIKLSALWMDACFILSYFDGRKKSTSTFIETLPTLKA